MNRRRRTALLAGGVALVVGAGVTVALAWPSSRSGRRTRALVVSTTTTARPVATATARRATTTSAPAPRQLAAHGVPAVPLPDVVSTPRRPRPTPTISPPASPWPPGTVVAYDGMQGSITFSPDTAPVGTVMSYVATITNPADHWLFVPLTDWGAFSIYLWTPQTEDGGTIPVIAKGVDPTAPEFQHSTPAGPRLGLLLAPHGSYTFSGRASNAVLYDWDTDYVAHADIIFTPVGVADARYKVARDVGTFTVLVPSSTTTATDPSA